MNAIAKGILVAATGLVLAGCGGTVDGLYPRPGIVPSGVQVSPNDTVVFEALATSKIRSVVWTADRGGFDTKVGNGRFFAKYYAPSSPGTYDVKVTMFLSNSTIEVGLATVSVE